MSKLKLFFINIEDFLFLSGTAKIKTINDFSKKIEAEEVIKYYKFLGFKWKRYSFKSFIVPPLHYNCRSRITPII